MPIFDKSLSYIKNFNSSDSPAPAAEPGGLVRVRVEVEGFPPAEKNLGPGNYTFGASADCDLIIPEAPSDEIALLHVRGGSEPHELVALARGLIVNGQALGLQQRLPVLSPTTLQMGPARIHLQPRTSAFQRAGNVLKNVKPPKSYATPMALMVVAFVLGVTAWMSSSRPARDLSSYTAPRAAGRYASAPALATSGDVVRELERLFKAADISEGLSITNNGVEVIVDGTVNGSGERRLQEALKNVTSRTQIGIRSRVKSDPSAFMSTIAGVSLTPGRYLVMRDGERYRAGDLMPNGWRVENIEARQVVITHDGLTEVLDLAQ